MNRKTLVVVAIFFFVSGCVPTAQQPVAVENALQSLVEKVLADEERIPGIALYVDAPSIGLLWEGAAGIADLDTGEAMTVRHPVRIASNTKTYISAAILRLWEGGSIDLDDPMTLYLSRESLSILGADAYDLEAITLRHLLTHTSGLYDYSHDDLYTEAILSDPYHRWTRTEQLEAAVEWGEPLGAPGDVFWYADTGYILLGEVLEQVTGKTMPAAVWSEIKAEELGLGASWFETLEPRPEGVLERAHQFLGDLDTAGFDPSYDLYGGGGIAATVGDMGRFYGALFRGDLYRDPATLEMMLTTVEGAWIPDGHSSFLAPGVYRMGIWEVEVEGVATWRHSGFFGTIATYVPEFDLVIAATVNQNQGKKAMEDLVSGVLEIFQETG